MEGYVTRRASISPNARKYALTVVSECVIQEESAGERGRKIYGLATIGPGAGKLVAQTAKGKGGLSTEALHGISFWTTHGVIGYKAVSGR